MSPTPVLLGFDVSPTKVGIGVVRDDDGRPVRAAVEPLAGPESLREVLTALGWSLPLCRGRRVVGWGPTNKARPGEETPSRRQS